MLISKFYKKALTLLLAGIIATSGFAGFWEWATPYRGPDKDVITLIITANYRQPLLLAQLIQYSNRQPYILLPTGNDKRIFFCPVSEKTPAREVKEENLPRFIHFLNPRQIIVLGNESYVPKQYLKLAEGKIPVFTISGTDWNAAAKSLGTLLDLTNLYTDYVRLSKKLESGTLYQPMPASRRNNVAPSENRVPLLLPMEEPVAETETDSVTDLKKSAPPAEQPVEADNPKVKEPEVDVPADEPQLIEDN